MNSPTELTDHLAGLSGLTVDLLANLTDVQLEEQAAYYRSQRGRSSGLNSYRWTTSLSAVLIEQRIRSGE